MKITLTKHNGYPRWKVDGRIAGRRIRRFYKTEAAALSAGEKLEQEAQSSRVSFAHCRNVDISKMLLAHQLCQEDGRDILEVVTRALAESPASTLPLGSAYHRYLKEKREMGAAQSTLNTLTCTLEKFCQPAWDQPIASIKRDYILAYLRNGCGPDGKKWHTRTKIGYLKEVQGLFAWAKKTGIIERDPAATISRPKHTEDELEERESRKEILTVKEARTLLTHCVMDYPRLLPRLAAQLFAGLRPNREAEGLRESDILLRDGLLLVRGKHAKDRQRRYIKMVPALKQWMEYCADKKLTLPSPNWKRDFNALRQDANVGGDQWPKNATRHSFASYHLVAKGEEATKLAMGHGSYDMIFQHYRTLVTEEQAHAYLDLTPEKIIMATKKKTFQITT